MHVKVETRTVHHATALQTAATTRLHAMAQLAQPKDWRQGGPRLELARHGVHHHVPAHAVPGVQPRTPHYATQVPFKVVAQDCTQRIVQQHLLRIVQQCTIVCRQCNAKVMTIDRCGQPHDHHQRRQMVQGNHMTTWAQQRKTHGRIDKPKHAKGTARSGVENVQACSPIFLFSKQKQAFGSPATRKNGSRQSQHAGLESIPLHIVAVFNDGLPRKRTCNIGNKPFARYPSLNGWFAIAATEQAGNPHLCMNIRTLGRPKAPIL